MKVLALFGARDSSFRHALKVISLFRKLKKAVIEDEEYSGKID